MLKQKSKQKTLVENCFKLSLKDFPKGILIPNKDISGIVEKRKGLDGLIIAFKRSYQDRNFVLFLNAKKKHSSFYQEITLDFDTITFGVRPYLLCSCGKRCNTLYLKPNTYEFVCRDCGDLVYELTRINRKAYGAELLYRHNRMMKIEMMKEDVKRICYSGIMTKKAKAIMRMMIKWKVDTIANEAISNNLNKPYC